MPTFAAPTRLNPTKKLRYIPSLIQTKFGLKVRPEEVGTCLVAQVVFSIAAAIPIPERVLERHILQWIDEKPAGELGWTLETILRTFELPVLTRRGPVWLDIDVHALSTYKAVVQAVVDGYPTIVIMPRASSDVLESEAISYRDGSAIGSVIRPITSTDRRFHSWLAVGVESRSDEMPYSALILRDTRDEYAFKGYLRIEIGLLKTFFKNVRALTVSVRDVRT